MAQEVFAVIGSGTIQQTHSILPPSQRGTEPTAQGVRKGTQVILANPEDLNSVEAFAASGIPVSTVPVEILSPGANPLPRMREVQIQNLGSPQGQATSPVFISNRSTDIPIEGFELAASGTPLTLPLMHNVSVWAATTLGESRIRMLIY